MQLSQKQVVTVPVANLGGVESEDLDEKSNQQK